MIRCSAALVLVIACAGAAEASRAVPPPLAGLLTQATGATPAEVVRLVDGWNGEGHPLLSLVRAQARWRLAQEAQGSERNALQAAAERDFTAAAAADPGLRQAHLGLAQCAAAREDWTMACRSAAAGIDPATADGSLLAFLASMALRAGDWRLATLTAQHGIMRFPGDPALRRIELAVLVNSGRAEDARQAVLAMLALEPEDAQLWRQLAWAAQETQREEESLAALEVVMGLSPGDQAVRLQLVQRQLGRGQPQAALATIRPLLGEPPSAAALADDALIQLATRAAAEAGEVSLARSWLAAVPEAQRSRPQRIQAARLAVQAGDRVAAAVALETLIVAGERDAAVLTWAATLAETAGDPARAEALYLRAAASDGPAAAGASLRLVALLLKHSRRDEARNILAAYLVSRPDDAQARALQAQLDRKR